MAESLKIRYHFDDCPLNCNSNGMVLDRQNRRWIPCPYCSEKRKKYADAGVVVDEMGIEVELATALGISNAKYLSGRFVYKACIPEYSSGMEYLFVQETLERQEEEANDLYSKLCAGELPRGSLCFGLGGSGRVDMFIFPMLIHAYRVGLKIAWVDSLTYDRNKSNPDYDVEKFFNADVLMVVLLEGDTLKQVMSVKGLMKLRSLRFKPTILVTTQSPVNYRKLLHGYSEDDVYDLAKPIFLQVKRRKGSVGYGKYMNGILGLKDEDLGTSNDDELMHMDSDEGDVEYLFKKVNESAISSSNEIKFSDI